MIYDISSPVNRVTGRQLALQRAGLDSRHWVGGRPPSGAVLRQRQMDRGARAVSDPLARPAGNRIGRTVPVVLLPASGAHRAAGSSSWLSSDAACLTLARNDECGSQRRRGQLLAPSSLSAILALTIPTIFTRDMTTAPMAYTGDSKPPNAVRSSTTATPSGGRAGPRPGREFSCSGPPSVRRSRVLTTGGSHAWVRERRDKRVRQP
jgi:hypothetical protein